MRSSVSSLRETNARASASGGDPSIASRSVKASQGVPSHASPPQLSRCLHRRNIQRRPHDFRRHTIERGVTHDTEFEKWANKVWNFGSSLGSEVSPKDFRKDVIVDVYNEAGQLVISYRLFRCWVSEFQSLPDLDANANAVAIQHIKLENEGWERDYEVAEPSEPSFVEPA